MTMKAETETVITWTLEDEKATVYSMMPRIWRMCLAAGGTEFRTKEGLRNGKKVGRWFYVDPTCIKIRPRRQLSDEQRRAMSERGVALSAKRFDEKQGQLSTESSKKRHPRTEVAK